MIRAINWSLLGSCKTEVGFQNLKWQGVRGSLLHFQKILTLTLQSLCNPALLIRAGAQEVTFLRAPRHSLPHPQTIIEALSALVQ